MAEQSLIDVGSHLGFLFNGVQLSYCKLGGLIFLWVKRDNNIDLLEKWDYVCKLLSVEPDPVVGAQWMGAIIIIYKKHSNN